MENRLDDLLMFILKSIIGESVDFDKKEDKEEITYIIRPTKEKTGIIIGKNGKTIKSITRILKMRAVIERVKLNVIVEPKE